MRRIKEALPRSVDSLRREKKKSSKSDATILLSNSRREENVSTRPDLAERAAVRRPVETWRLGK